MTRIALLGCGRIGKMHAATIARAEGTTLAAVYDPLTAAAEEIGRTMALWPSPAEHAVRS